VSELQRKDDRDGRASEVGNNPVMWSDLFCLIFFRFLFRIILVFGQPLKIMEVLS
jgi:hypothetical protein